MIQIECFVIFVFIQMMALVCNRPETVSRFLPVCSIFWEVEDPLDSPLVCSKSLRAEDSPPACSKSEIAISKSLDASETIFQIQNCMP